nr:fascin-like [Lytechinus pictus]
MACHFGLLSSNTSGKYLTSDFDGKISLSPLDPSVNKLSKGQLWSLEVDPNPGEQQREPEGCTHTHYALYSTNGYLSVDKSGKVSAEAEQIGKEQLFEIDVGTSGSGAWVIRSVAHDTYMGIKSKKIFFKKRETSSSDQRWYVRLAIHPHCCLLNVKSDKYAHVPQSGRYMTFDAAVPWRSDTLLQLTYSEGYSCFKTTTGRYVTREGNFVTSLVPDCLFVLQITGDQFDLKDYRGNFNSVNMRGRLMCTSGKDRASFKLKPSYPHVTFHTKVKGMWMKLFAKEGGGELTTLESTKIDEHEDEVVFELSPLCCSTSANSKWALVTVDGRFINVDHESRLSVASKATHTAKQFEFEFVNDSFALRHSNSQQYVSIDASGQPFLTANINDIAGKIGMELANRTSLILQGEFGFVKRETGGRKNKVKCNSADYDELNLTYEPDTITYRITDQDGNPWCMDSLKEHVIAASMGQPTSFILELHTILGKAKLAIRPLHPDNDCFLKGYKNGAFTATGDTLSKETLWTFN